MLSTGGYHNSMSPQALDGLAAIWADLARLAERHVEQLWVGPGKRQPQRIEELLSLLLMVIAGYCEEATAAAQPTRLVRSGPGQNDVGSGSFLAWRRAQAAGAALDACLAILLTVSAQLLVAEGVRTRGAGGALRAGHGDLSGCRAAVRGAACGGRGRAGGGDLRVGRDRTLGEGRLGFGLALCSLLFR